MTPSVTITLGDLFLALNEMGLTSVSAEELFRRLHPTPPLGMGLSLTQNMVVIHVKALEAALANVNLTDITAAQLINAVKKEESSLPTSVPEWKNDELPKCHPREPGSFPTRESTFTFEPFKDGERARLLELRDLVRKDIAAGRLPDPATWLNQSGTPTASK